MIVRVQIHPIDHVYLELCKLDLDHYLQNVCFQKRMDFSNTENL